MVRSLLAGAGFTFLLLVGCSGEGSFAAATAQQVGEYQIIDLAKGTVTWRAEAPDVAHDPLLTSSSLVLRRMPSQSAAQIGAATSEPFAAAADKPATTRAVRSCFIAVNECTASQWALLTGTALPTADGALPQVDRAHDEVLAGLAVFAARTGLNLDLPTQVEWEAAARWGHAGEFPFDPSQAASREAQARVRETVAGTGAAPVVGSRQPDPLGLYDLHGNVWELVRDLDGQGDAAARGGSWSDPVYAARASNRLVVPADAGHPLIGFRLVLRP
jgi:formylglycine-generating enzyme required for sulfatase activity